eukprot:TRINITY_DN2945_c1_g1_i1.p1 TRINITY_DN2945_c1_g1~~TRINITY_DN2945_c1_g1_i1.p1  ORF type:complete len:463 (+),score=78.20 TRINITY_DN2945_c1_g1_i1:48-1391(+)
MIHIAIAVLSALTCVGASGFNPNTPNLIIEAMPLMKLVNESKHGKLYTIQHGSVTTDIIHLYGTSHEMGYAHGLLLGGKIMEFMGPKLNQYYAQQIKFNMNGLPLWMQYLIGNATAQEAPFVMKTAMQYVFDREYPYIAASNTDLLSETRGIAEGICDSGTVPKCDVNEVYDLVKLTNMLPEVVKMSCSMMGAWGASTPSGHLTQLRTLDFGGGPFVNYSLVQVFHPEHGNEFVNFAFSGFTGAVTGFSVKIAMSEASWCTGAGHDNPNIDGEYNGLPVVGVIREFLQFEDSKFSAYNFAVADKHRTWAVFLGVGDFASEEFRVIAYQERFAKLYNYNNISQITGFPPSQDVVYIDKHCQPSHDNKTFPGLVGEYYGNLTSYNVVRNLPRRMKSGDVHTAVYDFGNREVFFSLGLVDSTGGYGPNNEGYACYQPYLKWNMDQLISGN